MTATQQIVGVCLADVREERIAWRSRGRLAKGKMSMFDGDPGLGKSTMLMDWAATVSRGEALPDGEPQNERGVLLICAEDDPSDTIRPRARVADADLSQIYILNEIPDLSTNGMRLVQFPEDCPLVEQIIMARNVGLVIVDPLSAFFGEGLKENSNQDVRKALSPLALVAQRTGASIALIRHLNKSQSANALYRGAGSIGLIGVVRFGLMAVEHPDEPGAVVLASTKSNLAPPPSSLVYRVVSVPGEDVGRIEWLGVSDHRASDLLSNAGSDDETRDELDDAQMWLAAYLEDGPKPVAELRADAKKVGIGDRALRRAKSKLHIKHRKFGDFGDAVWKWQLPTTAYVSPNGHHPTTEPDEEAF